MTLNITEIENSIVTGPSSTAGVFMGGPRAMCALPSGNIIWMAFAREKPAGTHRIEVLYSTDFGANWTSDSLLTIPQAASIHGPIIRLDSSGVVHMVYCNNPGSGAHIFYTKRISPNTWTAAVQCEDSQIIPTNLINDHSDTLDFAVTSDQKIHIFTCVAATGGVSPRHPFYITNESGSFVTVRMTTDLLSSTSPAWQHGGSITADGNDTLHVAAAIRRASPSADRLEYGKKFAGEAWKDWKTSGNYEVVFSTTSGNFNVAAQPSINCDTGSGVFIAQTLEPTIKQVNHFRRNFGGTWTQQNLQTGADSSYNYSAPSLAIDEEGTHFICYTSNKIGTFPTQQQPVYQTFVPGVSVPSAQILIQDNNAQHSNSQQTSVIALHHIIPFLGAPAGIPGKGFALMWHEALTNPMKIFFGITTDFEFASAADLVNEGPPSCQAEPDRASKVFAGEGTASLSYPLGPDFVFNEMARFDTIIASSDHGYDTTWPHRATNRRRWRIEHRNITKTQRDTVVNFFNARQGPVEAFNFTHPETGATIKVHFLSDKISPIKHEPNVYTIRLELEELF